VADLIRRAEARTLFGADVAGYDAGRPDYPPDVYRVLVERCGLGAGVRVLEIGPGTGMVTRHLLDAGATVVGIEPDPAFVGHLRRSLPVVEVVEGTLEEVTVDEETYDLAVAAMSFHWVDQRVGLPKVSHAIKPGGWFALWWTLWNHPERPDAFSRAAQQLHGRTQSEPNQHGRPPFEEDAETRLSDLRQLAGLTHVSHEKLTWTTRMDARQVRDHYASMIAVRRRTAAERRRLLDALTDLVDNEFGGIAERRFLTILYTGRK
jgi:SAM-dependent methyltransferase